MLRNSKECLMKPCFEVTTVNKNCFFIFPCNSLGEDAKSSCLNRPMKTLVYNSK